MSQLIIIRFIIHVQNDHPLYVAKLKFLRSGKKRVVGTLEFTLTSGAVHKRRHQSRGGCQKMILLNKLI